MQVPTSPSAIIAGAWIVAIAFAGGVAHASQPTPGPGFLEVHHFEGFFGCGAGTVGLTTTDVCGRWGVTHDEIHVFETPLASAEVTGAVYELVWTTSLTLKPTKLAFVYSIPETDEVSYSTQNTHYPISGVLIGYSPDQIVISSTGSQPLYGEERESILVQVRAPTETVERVFDDPEASNFHVVLMQPYDVFVSLFYKGKPIPDGYSAAP